MSDVQNVKVTIDGVDIMVPSGTTILQAARMLDNESVPPAMCFYTPLAESGGKCRTCLVRVAAGSEKDPRPMPKLVPSCKTTVMDGMIVEVKSNPKVEEARAGVTELLLINHPLDCPVCDQAGECDLQNLAFEHGKAGSRYDFKRSEFQQEDIGDTISLNKERCIICYRCVFVANEVCKSRDHGVVFRGDHAEISTVISENLNHDMIGNIIDVCPVGALTDRTARFKTRIWFANQFDAHRDCDKCCGKVVVHKKGDEIIRVSARKDKWGEVENWICNTCRFEKKDNADWTIDGPRKIERTSVQSLNHYETNEPLKVIKGIN
ncbi:MAG: 2Fe-2S iron-sulfur cluster-binding protein [Chitinophagales bacterium]|jgi:NADH-quinone oxidoreductase subunit G|nr:2Fe-2S iron-sulfur cluster-binding protein [Sphingobacteriales bacterium]